MIIEPNLWLIAPRPAIHHAQSSTQSSLAMPARHWSPSNAAWRAAHQTTAAANGKKEAKVAPGFNRSRLVKNGRFDIDMFWTYSPTTSNTHTCGIPNLFQICNAWPCAFAWRCLWDPMIAINLSYRPLSWASWALAVPRLESHQAPDPSTSGSQVAGVS